MPETKPTVVVLTALALEYAAVRAHITDREERILPGRIPVEIGRLADSPWRVALAELGEGALNAASLTTQILTGLDAEAVLFVGIAGSLKKDIGIGDVVLGTKVYGIHGGKWANGRFLSRPEAWHASLPLVQAARSAVRDMEDVRPHFKPIAAGDVVLADARAEIAAHLHEHYNDAAAIEMEGSGAAHAAHVNGQLDALVVRGISDRADARKSRGDAAGHQERAAEQAAEVAMAVLRKHRPRDRASSSPSASASGTEEGPQPPVYGGDHIHFEGGTFHGPVIGKITGR
ncbi:5'-methylthioadenosine/S-adenosylhomocysteine nucleosidase [Streptomyces sp. bgisy154]|uniref:5'-methylthioadenosine/S-adenosylhomocysteine nucleosidase n=1 Tax=Streptomyces sp. bgisy154 TaxID=3413794 RepID=UPI003D758892